METSSLQQFDDFLSSLNVDRSWLDTKHFEYYFEYPCQAVDGKVLCDFFAEVTQKFLNDVDFCDSIQKAIGLNLLQFSTEMSPTGETLASMRFTWNGACVSLRCTTKLHDPRNALCMVCFCSLAKLCLSTTTEVTYYNICEPQNIHEINKDGILGLFEKRGEATNLLTLQFCIHILFVSRGEARKVAITKVLRCSPVIKSFFNRLEMCGHLTFDLLQTCDVENVMKSAPMEEFNITIPCFNTNIALKTALKKASSNLLKKM